MAEKKIFARGVQPEVPAAKSITASHMQQAYVFENRRQQRRIEAFGKINLKTLKSLGAKIVKHVR